MRPNFFCLSWFDGRPRGIKSRHLDSLMRNVIHYRRTHGTVAIYPGNYSQHGTEVKSYRYRADLQDWRSVMVARKEEHCKQYQNGNQRKGRIDQSITRRSGSRLFPLR